MASNPELHEQRNSLRTHASTLLSSFEHSALVESGKIPQLQQYDSRRVNGHSLLNWAVDSAVQITKAAKGNLQIINPASGMLQIAAQRGFRQPFLDFFKCVHGGRSACRAARGGVPDHFLGRDLQSDGGRAAPHLAYKRLSLVGRTSSMRSERSAFGSFAKTSPLGTATASRMH